MRLSDLSGLRCLLLPALLSAVLLVACTTYQPQPLLAPEVEAVLDDPSPVVVAQNAGGLRHALIAPVVLDFSAPLSLDAISVNCAGAQAPIELTINCIVLALLINFTCSG